MGCFLSSICFNMIPRLLSQCEYKDWHISKYEVCRRFLPMRQKKKVFFQQILKMPFPEYAASSFKGLFVCFQEETQDSWKTEGVWGEWDYADGCIQRQVGPSLPELWNCPISEPSSHLFITFINKPTRAHRVTWLWVQSCIIWVVIILKHVLPSVIPYCHQGGHITCLPRCWIRLLTFFQSVCEYFIKMTLSFKKWFFIYSISYSYLVLILSLYRPSQQQKCTKLFDNDSRNLFGYVFVISL